MAPNPTIPSMPNDLYEIKLYFPSTPLATQLTGGSALHDGKDLEIFKFTYIDQDNNETVLPVHMFLAERQSASFRNAFNNGVGFVQV